MDEKRTLAVDPQEVLTGNSILGGLGFRIGFGVLTGLGVGRCVGASVRAVISVGGANTALITVTLVKGFMQESPQRLAFSFRRIVNAPLFI